jgi:hypothetical protein
MAGRARQAVSDATEGIADRSSRPAVEAIEEAVSSSGAGASGLSGLLGSAAGAATDPASQLGDLIEALEERVLVELERRGGRFAGTF